MAFNKQKTLEAAQKFLNQGKLPQAIAEYQAILRHDPKDQVTLMTVGDLFVRSGETQQSLEYFEKLAQIFLADGFNTKCIAIYKKIAKLAPEETAPLERLAELYIQQGVMSEARPLYLQIAEAQLKAKRDKEAVATLRKLLDLEPDNLRVQLRLAELYQAIGQKPEASLAFLNSAHRLIDRGDFTEAKKMADRALQADPKNARAATVKARAQGALGETEEAIRLLEGLPEPAVGVEATKLLSDLYARTGKADRAVQLAEKTLARNPENYAGVFDVAQSLVDGGALDAGLKLLGQIREAMMAAGDFDRLSRVLGAISDRLAGRTEPLEWMVDIYRRAKDDVRLPGAIDQLAEVCVAAGQLQRAHELFEELLKLEPEDENNRRRLGQVRQRLGLEKGEETPEPVASAAPPAIAVTPEAPPPFVAEMEALPEAAATPVQAAADDETQRYITQSLTDVDLFSSYGLTQKALDLLESVLKRLPRHVPTLEKLLDMSVGAGNDRRTAEVAAVLEQICTEQGDAAGAEKFSSLRRRYQRAAGIAAGELQVAPAAPPPAPAAEFTIPSVEAEPVPAAEVEPVPEAPVEATVHEVDLSEEWAAMSQTGAAEAPAVEAKPAEEEIVLVDDSTAVEAAPAPAEPAPLEPTPIELPPLEPSPAEATMEAEPAPPPAPEPIAPLPAAEEAPAAEVEYELQLEPAPAPAAAAPPAPVAAAPAEAKKDAMGDFLADLAAEVGDLEVAAPLTPGAKGAPARPAPAPAPVAAAPAGDVGLREVFDEFRAELGEMGDEKEDPETHYNLGIAYREMGLLEEAIGEFQKVAKVLQKGVPFRYAMQCCTLLGLCFMDKGQPAIAAMWYQKALETPGLDQETVLALRYDLGVAQEQAGETKAALTSFNMVYAMNIDYRDVADRIATLQKAK